MSRIRDLDAKRLERIRSALTPEGHVFLYARAQRSAAPLLVPFGLAVGSLFFAAVAPELIAAVKPIVFHCIGIGFAILFLLKFLYGLMLFAFAPIRPCIAVTRTRLVMVDVFNIRAWPIENVGAEDVKVSFGTRFAANVFVDSSGLGGRCDVLDLEGALRLADVVSERSSLIGTMIRSAYASKVNEADEFS